MGRTIGSKLAHLPLLEQPARRWEGSTGADQTVDNWTIPEKTTVDSNGDFVIADGGNNRVQLCSSSGVCSTVVETGTSLDEPWHVAFEDSGDYVIADYGNNRVIRCPASNSSSDVMGVWSVRSESHSRPLVQQVRDFRHIQPPRSELRGVTWNDDDRVQL